MDFNNFGFVVIGCVVNDAIEAAVTIRDAETITATRAIKRASEWRSKDFRHAVTPRTPFASFRARYHEVHPQPEDPDYVVLYSG